MSKKTIDELFQSKLSDFEFAQKEADWKLMKHMLNEQKKKKTLLFRFQLIFSGISMVAIALLFIFNPWSNTKTSNNKSQITNNKTQISIDKLQTSNPPLTSRVLGKGNLPPIGRVGVGQTSNFKLETSNNFATNTADVIISTSKTTINTNSTPSYLEYSVKSAYIGKDSVKTIITNMGQQLNSSFSDYAPIINADGTEMYFTSRRPVTEKEKKKKIESTENIYYTSFDAITKKWKTSVKLPSPVNMANRFNSIIALSNDGQQMLLYRDDKYGNGDIYESILNGKDWSTPKKLPEPVNSEHMETSASISPDGRTLYFVSNRPGGKGDLDIWYCTKNKQGKWGEAINLGEEINTPLKEEGVFIHPDGKTLYFSSRGHKGMGGYDIFFSRFENNHWSKPINLGDAINTPEDDVYFVMEANGKTAYYTSAKSDGFGEKDIYKVELITHTIESEKIGQLTLFKGVVIDKETSQPLESEIEIIDLEKNEVISQLKSNAVTGNFLMSLPSGKNYGINVKKQGYLFFSENMNIPESAGYKEIIKTVLLDKLRSGAKIVLKNIFYDYNKATLRSSSINELDRLYDLMVQNPELKIELSAHTDSRGSDIYNLNLSQQRAQSCLDYLITNKGINKDRLIAKGYGEQQLIVTDEEINKMSNEEEKEDAHQQNRRTEIKIIEN
ncbi:MAG: PD40 domain-containing protein [Bacteroidetes bacterium]|nr:PD40 domain-containing protein [Bacteroidota bacterium]